jgi:prolipoprotein diacylglyceryltransferase
LRWPTQAFESLFGFGLFVYLMWRFGRKPAPGVLFREFMLLFFGFRFMVEFIRDSGVVALGLSQAQWVSLVVMVVYGGEWAMRRTTVRASAVS